jgi:hypothetical protein
MPAYEMGTLFAIPNLGFSEEFPFAGSRFAKAASIDSSARHPFSQGPFDSTSKISREHRHNHLASGRFCF